MTLRPIGQPALRAVCQQDDAIGKRSKAIVDCTKFISAITSGLLFKPPNNLISIINCAGTAEFNEVDGQ